MKIGIDKIGFATSHLYVDMAELAKARNEEPGKYLVGLGQSKMAVIPPSQDPVTLACSAAAQILTPEDKGEIGLVIFGTESGIDNSKAASMYVAELLGLPENIRSFEIKQACYGATAGIAMARGYLALNPKKKVLVFGADIARYGIKTSGESTQGGGAVALLLSGDPSILEFEPQTSYLAQNVMDFWRPLGHSEALVQGKYSSQIYLDFFEKVYHDYLSKTHLSLADFSALVFHLPYTKMGLKALRKATEDAAPELSAKFEAQFEASREYSRNVGNLYTGSLYLSLLSLLQNSENLVAGQRIGLFSYGSGAQGEFFSGILQPGFKALAADKTISEMLLQRKQVSVKEYEKIYRSSLEIADNVLIDHDDDPASFVLTGVKDAQRKYAYKLAQ
ncbi:hydroxymethylglutaryl-CoA synthase [Ligilactobacillus acidipiscis]|jgi:hydroxymethylglutaryl-CoA synthase|uniref:hydroxymethylglutaryl-CoA synthase n=1 Tax=Ligilactobacillus acidipiscis TaxID=89059 RepID=UPI0029F608FE|nr:hydroxymethylglutaryl-CoA synthase [Ligilactobacillus acidipiscis]MCI1953854.1 hydroxymethylglutaryl-CoA synthase [Ligilactobacillus acidipiscis]